MRTAVSTRRGPAVRLQLAIKRALDVAVSAVLLALISPLYAAIALGVKLTSRGPSFYRWEVIGQCGRPFTGYKFRTMVADADAQKEALMASNEMSGPVFKMKRDPRVTRFGRFLRTYSLDELPQLWSVLKGDMSLVGPRPPLRSEYVRFTDFQKQKLAVKPGLTCLWQVRGRSAISDLDEWVRLDLEYIERWSLWLDFQILAATIPVVLFGKGAY